MSWTKPSINQSFLPLIALIRGIQISNLNQKSIQTNSNSGFGSKFFFQYQFGYNFIFSKNSIFKNSFDSSFNLPSSSLFNLPSSPRFFEREKKKGLRPYLTWLSPGFNANSMDPEFLQTKFSLGTFVYFHQNDGIFRNESF